MHIIAYFIKYMCIIIRFLYFEKIVGIFLFYSIDI